MHLEQIKGASKEEVAKFRRDSFKFSEDVTVPCWIEYFLNLAKEISKRSKDGQTKVGAVLTDYNNHIINLNKTFYNVYKIKLISTEFPNTEKIIKDTPLNRQNNKLFWQIIGDGNHIYDIDITPGNYDIQGLISEMQNQIQKRKKLQRKELNLNQKNRLKKCLLRKLRKWLRKQLK